MKSTSRKVGFFLGVIVCFIVIGFWSLYHASPMRALEEKLTEQFEQWLANIQEGDVFKLPHTVYWLNGAPGAGKGTQTQLILEKCGIKVAPVVMSDLFKSKEFQERINAGLLIDDRVATESLFKKLASLSHEDAVLVDGFPRTPLQADFLHFLLKHNLLEHTEFRFVTLGVTEKVSIERQLNRGNEAKAQGQSVRSTDKDPQLALKRYQVFSEETLPALNRIKSEFPGIYVDVGVGLEEAKSRVENALKGLRE